MHPYRVFVSYSHDDRELTEKVVQHLQKIGVKPIWDEDLRGGEDFRRQLEMDITFAHVFVPILTPTSSVRPWVNQEIGYAKGKSIPVLPLALGKLPPEGIIQQIEPLSIDQNLANLEQVLKPEVIHRVVNSQDTAPAVFECAESPHDRKKLIAGYARKVVESGEFGKVRQKGALTAFSIPDQPLHDPIWTEREGAIQRDAYYHELQLQQREALEEHARRHGCDLIVDLAVEFASNGPRARAARLRTLVEFLESMPDTKVRAVVQTRNEANNTLIVGDWFVAESFTPHAGTGCFHTICTWHGPTVLKHIADFDAEFAEELKSSGRSNASSRVQTIKAIRKVMAEIDV